MTKILSIRQASVVLKLDSKATIKVLANTTLAMKAVLRPNTGAHNKKMRHVVPVAAKKEGKR